jgi:hypothetical protein
MAQRKKIIYRIIYFLPVAALLLFICLGVRYERTIVGAAEYKPSVVGVDNISAKVYLLDAKRYLLVLSETDGRRMEGYLINPSKKKIGYANFSASTYTPLFGSWAMIDRAVLDGYKAVEELNADFQNLPAGVMITLKGPTELAVNLDQSVESVYKKRLICRKTILLER